MKIKQLFHYISYLQYPLMLVGLYFVVKPYLVSPEDGLDKFNYLFKCLNNALIFSGLGISFSTLQDTTKTQNEVSKKVWEHPTKGKLMLIVMSLSTISFLITGVIAYFKTSDSLLKEVSFGLIVLGIGLIGLLKTAAEMFDNHRMDKN